MTPIDGSGTLQLSCHNSPPEMKYMMYLAFRGGATRGTVTYDAATTFFEIKDLHNLNQEKAS